MTISSLKLVGDQILWIQYDIQYLRTHSLKLLVNGVTFVLTRRTRPFFITTTEAMSIDYDEQHAAKLKGLQFVWKSFTNKRCDSHTDLTPTCAKLRSEIRMPRFSIITNVFERTKADQQGVVPRLRDKWMRESAWFGALNKSGCVPILLLLVIRPCPTRQVPVATDLLSVCPLVIRTACSFSRAITTSSIYNLYSIIYSATFQLVYHPSNFWLSWIASLV